MPLKTLGPIGPRAVGERVKAVQYTVKYFFMKTSLLLFILSLIVTLWPLQHSHDLHTFSWPLKHTHTASISTLTISTCTITASIGSLTASNVTFMVSTTLSQPLLVLLWPLNLLTQPLFAFPSSYWHFDGP
jgi:hypothetical protein